MTPPELIQFVSDGVDRAKANEAAQVYATVCPYYDQGQLPLRSHYAFGWIIYYALHQGGAYDIAARKQMLARYLNLSVTRPHKLHSMILTEAIRLYKDAAEATFVAKKNRSSSPPPSFSIIRFSSLWNLINLRPGDWRRKDSEGKILNSTVEKFITCYVNELESDGTLPSTEFQTIFNEALRQYPDSSTLMAQAATLHEICGEKDKAKDWLRSAVLATPSKFFLWSRLAGHIDKDRDIKLHIALLHKALTASGPEEYKGKVRLALAKAWISIKGYPQALYELNALREIYLRNGWNLSSDFKETESAIPELTKAVNPAPAYSRISALADEFLVAGIPEIAVKKTFHKPGGETTDRYGNRRQQPVAWRVSDNLNNNYWFNPSRFRISEELPMQTSLLVKIYNGKIVGARIPEE